MEAKELMVNDLVKVTKGNLVGRICDINQSRDFVGYCNIDAEETYLEASYMKYIEPIPLTEEILDKNCIYENDDINADGVSYRKMASYAFSCEKAHTFRCGMTAGCQS